MSKYEVLMEYKCSETHYVMADSEEEAIDKVMCEGEDNPDPEINVHYWEMESVNKVEEENNE
tara:strand:+ start:339 stop:524 length:186 start_codon:yes stop_codon:yes gene_type:complete